MNNDKRIILAIALYAAVITMVLHTLSSEGHARFSSTEVSAQYHDASSILRPMPASGVPCSEFKCTEESACSYSDEDANGEHIEQGKLNEEEQAS